MAVVLTLALFLAPVQTCLQVRRDGDIRDYSEVSFITSLFNCLLWVVYSSITPGRIQSFIINAVGGVLQSGYIVWFLAYSTGEAHRRIWQRTVGMVLTFALLICLDLLLLPHLGISSIIADDTAETDYLGVFCSVLNVGMYAAPLSVMALVVETRSVEFMPLFLTLGVAGCTVSWAIYGMYVGDIWIGIPNYLGTVVAVFQLGLYGFYANTEESRAAFAKVSKFSERERGRTEGGGGSLMQQQISPPRDPPTHHSVRRFRLSGSRFRSTTRGRKTPWAPIP